MNYFGANKRVKVENTYHEGPKAKLARRQRNAEVVVHSMPIRAEVRGLHKRRFVKQQADKLNKLNVRPTITGTVTLHVAGKRGELSKHFGTLNEVSNDT